MGGCLWAVSCPENSITWSSRLIASEKASASVSRRELALVEKLPNGALLGCTVQTISKKHLRILSHCLFSPGRGV